jgi:hypothetical protein
VIIFGFSGFSMLVFERLLEIKKEELGNEVRR